MLRLQQLPTGAWWTSLNSTYHFVCALCRKRRKYVEGRAPSVVRTSSRLSANLTQRRAGYKRREGRDQLQKREESLLERSARRVQRNTIACLKGFIDAASRAGLFISVIVRGVIPTPYEGIDGINLDGGDIVIASSPPVSVAGGYPSPIYEARFMPHTMRVTIHAGGERTASATMSCGRDATPRLQYDGQVFFQSGTDGLDRMLGGMTPANTCPGASEAGRKRAAAGGSASSQFRRSLDGEALAHSPLPLCALYAMYVAPATPQDDPYTPHVATRAVAHHRWCCYINQVRGVLSCAVPGRWTNYLRHRRRCADCT